LRKRPVARDPKVKNSRVRQDAREEEEREGPSRGKVEVEKAEIGNDPVLPTLPETR
jgi:hypothetical protein